MSNVVKYLKDLIKFKTVDGEVDEFEKCWDYIDAHMRQVSGWDYREYELSGYKSRVYSHKKHIETDEKEFDIYLYSHIDVVNGNGVLFTPIETEDKIVGRGAIDMKFADAVNIAVLQNLPSGILEKKIAFIITSDEEVGGQFGAKYLAEEIGLRGGCVIAPDGTTKNDTWKFELKNKGTIHTKFYAKGKSAHGSRKWEGDNALERLIDFYQELKAKFDIGNKDVWKSTLNLGVLKGGTATNSVADEAMMQTDFRYVDEDERQSFYREIDKLAKKYNVVFDHYVDAAFIDVPKDNSFIKAYRKSAEKFMNSSDIQDTWNTGSFDAREFFKVGITPIILMPRCGAGHSDDEWIMKEDLETLVKVNVDFIRSRFKI